MSGGTIFSQIQIELVILFLKIHLLHSLNQFVIIVFPLAASDDLADSRYQTVHCCHRFSVLIELHVKCLDLFRIVRYKDRTLVHHFCQITLMFCLQVCAPFYFIFKLIIIFLEKFYRLCICYSRKIRVYHVFQPVQQPLVYKRIEEVHLLRRILQHIRNHIFQH